MARFHRCAPTWPDGFLHRPARGSWGVLNVLGDRGATGSRARERLWRGVGVGRRRNGVGSGFSGEVSPCRVFQRIPAVPRHIDAPPSALPCPSAWGEDGCGLSAVAVRQGGVGGFWEVGRQVARQGEGIEAWQERWGRVPVTSCAGDKAFIGPTESGNRRGSSRDGRGRIRSSPISPGCPSKVIVPATPLDSRSSTRLSGRTSERPGILLGANGRLRLPSGPPAMPTRHPKQ